MVLLIQFFLAHILGDFFFQGKKMVEGKERDGLRSPYLYIHVMIHFLLVLITTLSFNYWKQALIIAVIHFIIDWMKTRLQTSDAGNRRRWFFIDQALHIATLVVVWSVTQHMVINLSAFRDLGNVVRFTAVVFLTLPTSFIIKKIIDRWMPDILETSAGSTISASSSDRGPRNIIESLKDAGHLIGILERLFVFLFIILGKWEGVGFLLTAKSVFRFGDLSSAKDKKLTEYVLIGTFLSFGIAIGVGLIVLNVLKAK